VAPSMPSLRQLLATHPAILVVDTCATFSEAALWQNTSPCAAHLPAAFHAAVEGEAAHALPQVVAQVLAAARLEIGQLDAVAFCAGPGSVLGIRLAAASVRIWRVTRPGLAVYSYLSLPLLATSAAAAGASVIADARRESWHVVRRDTQTIERLPSTALANAGPLVTPATFRRWSLPPEQNPPADVAYKPADLLAASPDADLFTPAPDPDAFVHEQPSYVTWTPQVHQAPPARPTA